MGKGKVGIEGFERVVARHVTWSWGGCHACIEEQRYYASQIMTSRSGRRNEIQALRGVAVLGVVLFHFFPTNFPFGFLGVDIFFVISGYVMAPLLQSAALAPKTNRPWILFYKRRLFRLAPAFGVAALLIVIAILLFQPTSAQPKQLMLLLSSFIFLASPVALLTENNYFTSGNNPAIHLWSLSIEEQFYFLIPILIIISMRIFPNMKSIVTLKKFFLVTFIFSFGFFLLLSLQMSFWSAVEIQKPQSIIFYLFPFRLWQFLLGSSAYYLTKIRAVRSSYIPILLLTILLSLRTSKFFSEFLISILICILTFFICANHCNFQEQNFINKILIWAGDASYSIYLLHMPIVVIIAQTFQQYANFTALFKICGIALSLYFGRMSYEKIECKFRSQNEFKVATRQLIMKFYLLPLIIVILALTLSQNNYFSVLEIKPSPEFSTGENSTCNKLGIRIEKPCISHPEFQEKLALLGDSHAQSISQTFEEVTVKKGLSFYNYSTSGCPFVPSSVLSKFKTLNLPSQLLDSFCLSRNAWVEQAIVNEKFSQIAISSATYYSNESEKKVWLDVMSKTLYFLDMHSKNLVIIGPNPVLEEFGTDQYLLAPFNLTGNSSGLFKLRSLEIGYNEYLNFIAQEIDAKFLDLLEVYCDGDKCRGWNAAHFLFFDSSHLSTIGAGYLLPPLSQIIG